MMTEKDPLITVVMATYNRAYIIDKAIRSVQDQNYKNWELLVVDDKSTDDTSLVVEKFVNTDSRIKYIKLEKNLGCSGARNEGMKICNGEYITFLDSDDEYDPRKLQLQWEVFKNSKDPDLGVVSCGAIDFMDGKEYNRRMPVSQKDMYKSLLEKRKNLGAGSPFLMVKKQILEDDNIYFDQEMPAMIDWDFLLRITKKYSFDYVEEYLVYVNHHSNDRMYNGDSAVKALNLEYNKYMQWFKEKPRSHYKFVKYAALLMSHYKSVELGQEFLQKSLKNFDNPIYLSKLKTFEKMMFLLKYKYIRLLYFKYVNS